MENHSSGWLSSTVHIDVREEGVCPVTFPNGCYYSTLVRLPRLLVDKASLLETMTTRDVEGQHGTTETRLFGVKDGGWLKTL